MHFSTFILAIAVASVQASPLVEGVSPALPALPKTQCCWCDAKRGGMRCRPVGLDCHVTTDTCDFDPKTQEQCCYCDISEGGKPAIQCKPIPKGGDCITTLVVCPFPWDKSFQPVFT